MVERKKGKEQLTAKKTENMKKNTKNEEMVTSSKSHQNRNEK